MEIKASDFFKAWCKVVNEKDRKNILLDKWSKSKEYTDEIINNENAAINAVAVELNLLSYTRNYYSIDSVLYLKDDLVPNIKIGTHWFREIKVAFEHENKYNNDLY